MEIEIEKKTLTPDLLCNGHIPYYMEIISKEINSNSKNSHQLKPR